MQRSSDQTLPCIACANRDHRNLFCHQSFYSVCDCLKNGSSPVRSAVEFTGTNVEVLLSILKMALPKEHETVHLSENTFLYLSVRGNEDYLKGLSNLVSMAKKRTD